MNKKGYFLVEAIVAITIVAIIITVVFANLSKSYVNENNEMTKYNTTEGLYTAKEVNKALKNKISSYGTSLGTTSYVDATSDISETERTALNIKKIFFTTYEIPNDFFSRADIPVLIKQNLTKPSENEENCEHRYIIIFNDNSYSSIGVDCNGDFYKLTVKPNGGTWKGSTSEASFAQRSGSTTSVPDPTGTYTITYDGNGQGATYTPSPTSIPKAFKKWQLRGGGTLKNGVYTFGNRNATLTAKWQSSTFTLPQITKTGHTCKWAEGTVSGTQYEGGTQRTINKNMTYYAKCSPNKYSLTVDPNGGTWNGYTTAQVIVQNYGTTTSVLSPKRTGYTFRGWEKTPASGGGSLRGTTYTFGEGDTTLTAKWEANEYTLLIDPDGGTWQYEDGGETTDEFVKYFKYEQKTWFSTKSSYYNENLKITSQPTKEGYTFDGWEIVDGGGSIGSASYPSIAYRSAYYFDGNYTDYVEIKAKWKVNTYTLTVNPNGGLWQYNSSVKTTENLEKDFTYNKQIWFATTTTNYNTSLKIGSQPKKTGYTFDGWEIISGGGSIRQSKRLESQDYNTYYYDGKYAGNVEIKAKWIPSVHNLAINLNGGKFHFSSDGYDTGTVIRQFTYGNEIKINYNDVGWGTSYSIGNYGSQPTRTGYTFDGWKIIKGGGSVKLKEGIDHYLLGGVEPVNEPYAYYYYDGMYDGDVEIEAKWKANTHNLTINLNGGEWKIYSSSSGRTTEDFTKQFTYGTNTKFAYKRDENGNSSYIDGSVGSGPLKSGYEFNGWAVAYIGADGKIYGTTTNKGQIKIGTNSDGKEYYYYDGMYDGDVTIVALWKAPSAPSCTITLDGTPGDNGWYKSGVKVKLNVYGTATTKGLGTTENPTNGYTSITENGEGEHTYYGYVANTGGSSTCQVTFKNDWHGPNCTFGFTGDDGEANWNNYLLTCDSDTGGSGCNANANGKIEMSNDYRVYDNAGNSCYAHVDYLTTMLHYIPGGATGLGIPLKSYATLNQAPVSTKTVSYVKIGDTSMRNDSTYYKLNFYAGSYFYWGTTSHGGYWLNRNSGNKYGEYRLMPISDFSEHLYACYKVCDDDGTGHQEDHCHGFYCVE